MLPLLVVSPVPPKSATVYAVSAWICPSARRDVELHNARYELPDPGEEQLNLSPTLTTLFPEVILTLLALSVTVPPWRMAIESKSMR